MRVLFFTTEFPNPYDPTKAVFNLHLARALAVRHDVKVIAPIPWVEEARGRARAGRLARPADTAEIEVHHPRYYYVPKVFRRQTGRFLWWSARRTIHRVLRDFTPDAVLGYWAHPDGEVAVRSARLCGAAAGVIVGGSDILLTGEQPGRRGPIQRVLRSADAVITVGRHLRQEVLRFGVEPDRVHAWDRGVDQTRFMAGNQTGARGRLALTGRGAVLLWVGRMVPVKAVNVLVAACGQLRDRGTAFHLYLVGDGELRPTLEAQVAALKLSDAVTFVGPQLHEQMPDWFRAADLTVLPSLSEGIPNVLRESLACGTRFVASQVGGIPELATEPFDRLVPPNNPADLADAIVAALSNQTEAAPARIRGVVEEAEELVRVLRPHMRPMIAARRPRSPVLPIGVGS